MNGACRKFVVSAVAGALCLAGAAADYVWLADPAGTDWLAQPNWNLGVWTNGANAASFGASSARSVRLGGDVDAAAVTVSGADYAFSDGRLNLNGRFTVDADAAVDFAALLRQTSSAAASRLDRSGGGTLRLAPGEDRTNRVFRLRHSAGTTVLDGGALCIDGSSTSAGESGVTGSFLGGEIVFANGAEMVFTNTSYLSNCGATFTVTNGVLDISAVKEFLNGFKDNGASGRRSVLTVADKGEIRASQIRISKDNLVSARDNVQINVLTGGVLRISQFSLDGGSYPFYGTVNLDGGWICQSSDPAKATALFGSGSEAYWARNWATIDLRVGAGGFRFRNNGGQTYLYKGLSSGAARDGGFHLSGKGTTYFSATNDYNGGTWFEGDQYAPYCNLALKFDRALGAVPEAPEDNIFFDSPYTASLHAAESFDLHPNRTVVIGSNRVARLGAQTGRTLRVKGVIEEAGRPAVNTAALTIAPDWPGTVALDPGAGRTNLFGRLLAYGSLVIESGVTALSSENLSSVKEKAQLYIKGNGEYYTNTLGTVVVSGGTLTVREKIGRFVESSDYGQLIVTGGLVDFSEQEYLNGLEMPGRLTVSGTGVMDCRTLRVSQSGRLPHDVTSVNVCTGGTLRLQKFTLDEKQVKNMGVINLNGGTLEAKTTTSDFIGNDMATWRTNVYCYVREGGAVIDTKAFEVKVKNSLYSGAEADGGLVKRGSGALILLNTNTYNGVTTVEAGTLCLRRPSGCLPPGNTLAIRAGAECHTVLTTGVTGTQTLARVEGAGKFGYSSNLTVTDALAPGDGEGAIGTLTIGEACSLAGTLDIDGDASSSDCLVVSSGVQDLSRLGVRVNDLEALSQDRTYTVFSAPGGFAGTFAALEPSGTPWALRYDRAARKVYLGYRRGTTLLFR